MSSCGCFRFHCVHARPTDTMEYSMICVSHPYRFASHYNFQIMIVRWISARTHSSACLRFDVLRKSYALLRDNIPPK